MAQQKARRLHQMTARVGERPHVFVPLRGEGVVRIYRHAKVGKHPRPVRRDTDIGIGVLADKKTDNRFGGGVVAEPSHGTYKNAFFEVSLTYFIR